MEKALVIKFTYEINYVIRLPSKPSSMLRYKAGHGQLILGLMMSK